MSIGICFNDDGPSWGTGTDKYKFSRASYSDAAKKTLHVQFNPPRVGDITPPINGEDAIYQIVHQIQVKIIEMRDQLIVDAVIQEAEAAGIDDLWIIDRQFVLDALTEKLMREREADT